ncbi:MAG TPA: sugar ABC transporter permease [Chloroflexota bacterium]|nr:sugar ABC transporter permease [Chloroflexota bacterium]
MAVQTASIGVKQRRRRGGLLREEALWGWLMQIPNVVGLTVFAAGPLIVSFGLIFTHYQMITPPTPAGLDNVNELINDPLFPTVVANTAYVTLISVPLYMLLGLLLALALHQKLRGIGIYRTIFFLPSQMPPVANVVLWLWLFNPDYGLANWVLDLLHIPESTWIQDPVMAKPSLIILGIWGIGSGMIIYLAGLQNIPEELHEAASIDGAGTLRRFFNVTLPLLSPVIFFNLIIGIIQTMQSGFTTVYLATSSGQHQATDSGGPDNALLLFVLYIFHKGFIDFDMGYASLLAWVLFIFILALTIINFRLAGRWVYYEGQLRG